MTILNEYVKNATSGPIISIILGCIIGIFFLSLIYFIAACRHGDKNSAGILLVLTLCTMIGSITLAAILADKSVYTAYEVILSDDYPATELLENYEIVEQRGEILVIRDKKQDKEDQNGKGKN